MTNSKKADRLFAEARLQLLIDDAREIKRRVRSKGISRHDVVALTHHTEALSCYCEDGDRLFVELREYDETGEHTKPVGATEAGS
ncbi:MAG: hypothetical protein ACF8XB_12565 [Planctomycetota bacterium JB042]